MYEKQNYSFIKNQLRVINKIKCLELENKSQLIKWN